MMGRIVHASCRTVFGRWITVLVVTTVRYFLSTQLGAGMAYDRTEVTDIPSVLAESGLHAYLC
jgi:hypothetical protein